MPVSDFSAARAASGSVPIGKVTAYACRLAFIARSRRYSWAAIPPSRAAPPPAAATAGMSSTGRIGLTLRVDCCALFLLFSLAPSLLFYCALGHEPVRKGELV